MNKNIKFDIMKYLILYTIFELIFPPSRVRKSHRLCFVKFIFLQNLGFYLCKFQTTCMIQGARIVFND